MDLERPLWLVALFPVAAGWVLLAARRRADLPRLTLLAASAALLALGAAGPTLRTGIARRVHVLVLDRSDSVALSVPGAEAAQAVRDHAAKFAPGDRVGLVVFGGDAAVALPLSPPSELAVVDPSAFAVAGEATDEGAALDRAASLLPGAGQGEILLVGDGRHNAGDRSAGSRAASFKGVRVHTAPAGREPWGDFGVESFEAPALADPGASVALTARVFSRSGGPAQVRFRDDRGRELASMTREFLPGETLAFQAAAPLPGAGEARYEVSVAPLLGRDPVPANDSAETAVRASGVLRVLHVSEEPSARLFGRLLERVPGARVASVAPFRLGPDPRLDDADLVVLDGVSAEALGDSAMRAVERFVRDGGGGLLLLGGPEGFGLGGYFETPVERASPVECDPEEKAAIALAVLFDASGSMGDEIAQKVRKFDEALHAVARLLAKMKKGDFVAVIPFSENPLVNPSLQAEVGDGPPSGVDKALFSLRGPSGATSILKALRAGLGAVAGRKEARRHVLLFSDGVETVEAEAAQYDALRGAFDAANVTVSAAVTSGSTPPGVLRFLRRTVVRNGRLYEVAEFSRLHREFLDDLVRARGDLRRDGTFEPLPGFLPPGVPDAAPPAVASFVRTALKKEAARCAWSVGAEGLPLLAWWRCGLGRAAAFTSGLEEGWAPAWTKWAGAGGDRGLVDFWAPWIRWAAGEEKRTPVQLRREKEGFTVRVRGRGLPRAGFPDGLELRARLLQGTQQASETPLLQEGPGEYAGRFPAGAHGSLRVLVLREPGGEIVGEGGLFVGSSPETRLLGPDREALRRLCSGGGRFWDSAGEFVPGPPEATARGGVDAGWVLTILGAGAFAGAAFFRRRP